MPKLLSYFEPVRRIYANLGLLLTGKALAGIISLAYMLIAVRVLGPRDYGVLVLVHGFVMTVDGLINFPAWQAIMRYGEKPMMDGDNHRLLRLLRFTTAIEMACGVIAVAVTAILAPIIGPRLGWSAEAQAFAIPYSFAALANVRSTPAGYLQLIRRFGLLGLHNAVPPVVRLIGAIIVALAGWGLKGFLIAWLCAALAEWISLWVMGIYAARHQFGIRPLFGKITDVRGETPGLGRFMIGTNADVTLSDLASRLAPLVIGWMLGPVAAAFYSVAQRATVIIAQPAQILGQAVYAELAKLVARGDHGAPLRQALIRSTVLALLIALPILIIIAIFSKQIIMLLAGPAFASAAGLMILLATARVILVVAPSASAALIAMGHPGWSVTSNLLSSVGLLPLLAILTTLFGLSGAGFQAIIQALTAASLLIYFVWRSSAAVAPPTRSPAAANDRQATRT
jgi:O-antigen/teichoic acid export membrane protein